MDEIKKLQNLTEEEKNDRIKKIKDGFKINFMVMRDADSGKVVWESGPWKDTFSNDGKIEVPASILQLKAVSREMNFTTKEMIGDFKLVQTIMLFGKPLEEWRFDFGFVIPGTTNSWQCILVAAGGDQMIPAQVLSGNVTIETKFYDGDLLVSKTHLKVFYV